MARLLGTLPLNGAEKKVVLALKEQCPPDWIVIPGVRWAIRDRFVRDGEADAVVLAPNLGLLVVEVKGSAEIRVSNGEWERLENGKWIPVEPTPVEQAMGNAHTVCRILREEHRWSGQFPGLFGWLVVYPNGNASRVPAAFDSSTLATRAHMDHLGRKARDALLARGNEELGAQFTRALVEKAAVTLTSSDFRLVPADGAEEVLDDKAAIEALTRQQFHALSGLFQMPSVAIVGPAGSGKTVLALWHLQALHESGRRAVYVCFNKVLAESLRLANPTLSDCIKSVDRLFGEIAPSAARTSDPTHFHREHLPTEVFDRVTSQWNEEKKYDAVLVDEAQDFSDTQILALSVLRRKEGSWALFLDRQQDLYRVAPGGDVQADVVFRLQYNCRNTSLVNRAANGVSGNQVESHPDVPPGAPVQVEFVKRDQMANRAYQLASQWNGQVKGKDGHAPTIAILSPYVLERSAMAGHDRGHGIELRQSINGLGAKATAYFSTIKSFKGLEADCVVLVDAKLPGGPALAHEDLYVACTRAKLRLVLLTDDQVNKSGLEQAVLTGQLQTPAATS